MSVKRKKNLTVPQIPQELESAEEPTLSESLELDDILQDFREDASHQTAPPPEEPEWIEDTVRLDRAALRETLQEAPLPAEKPQKRRGKKKNKAAPAKAAQPQPGAGDTVRLDRSLIRAMAAEQEERTVRFSPPASEEAKCRAQEGAPTRVYGPEETEHLAPISYEEDVLTPEDRAEIAETAAEQAEKTGEKKSVQGEKFSNAEWKVLEKPGKTLEKRYEEAAMGLSGAQVRLFLAVLLTAASLILTALDLFRVLQFRGGASFLPFLQMVLFLLCALMCYDVAVEGLLRLFRLRPDAHTVLLVLLVFTAIDGVECILSGRSPYSGLTCLNLTLALWADCQNRSRICETIEVVRRTSTVDAALRESSFWEGKDGVLRGRGDVDRFYTDQDKVPGAVRARDIYLLCAMAAALILSALTCGGSFPRFTWSFTGILLAGCPAWILVAVSRPWSNAAHRLKAHGAALSGWAGAKAARGKLAVPLSDRDLFPEDKLRMNGMKLYPDVDPDKTIAYGAAAICAADSGLSGIFTELVQRRNLRTCRATNLRRYDNGGISAEVGQDSVLAGSMAFMQAMGVDLPEGTRVNQAVYVAVNGFLGGVFAVNYAVTRAAVGGVNTLVRSSGVTPVLTAQDFVITPQFLHQRFKTNPGRIVFPTTQERAALTQRRPSEQARQIALLTRPEFASLAKAVTCGRTFYASAMWSTAVGLLSGILGLTIAGVLTWIGALATLSAANLLLFALLWSIPMWILTGLVRSA